MQASDIAWQPFTPAGVAAFARSRLFNLLVLQWVVALVLAGTVLWFLSSAWFPVVGSAVQRLPPGGAIRSGRLDWPGEPATVLAENHFLAIAVDLQHLGLVRSPAHVQVEFGERGIRAFSLLGMTEIQYPKGKAWAFSREELVPWWGAWSPALLAILCMGTVFWLFLMWFLLATLYCPVAWLVGFFADRGLTLRGAWRLAGAALMPGALFMEAALVGYGLGALDVVRLLAAVAAHVVIGWIYLVVGPFWCPRHPAAESAKGNPFTGHGAALTAGPEKSPQPERRAAPEPTPAGPGADNAHS